MYTPSKSAFEKALAFIRITVGFFLIYHGFEIFDRETMSGYMNWDIFKNTAGTFLVYSGKAAELTAGMGFVLGLFIRLSALVSMVTFLTITFFVGKGHFWYEDQHPFLFALFGFLLFFSEPDKWSLDRKWRKVNNAN